MPTANASVVASAASLAVSETAAEASKGVVSNRGGDPHRTHPVPLEHTSEAAVTSSPQHPNGISLTPGEVVKLADGPAAMEVDIFLPTQLDSEPGRTIDAMQE